METTATANLAERSYFGPIISGASSDSRVRPGGLCTRQQATTARVHHKPANKTMLIVFDKFWVMETNLMSTWRTVAGSPLGHSSDKLMDDLADLPDRVTQTDTNCPVNGTGLRTLLMHTLNLSNQRPEIFIDVVIGQFETLELAITGNFSMESSTGLEKNGTSLLVSSTSMNWAV